jgi:hypothetical protein
MADAIDDLERALSRAVNPEILPSLYQAIDQWRQHHGGCRAYIARHSIERRKAEIVRLSRQGMKPTEVANMTGLTPQHIRRISRKSSYL